MKIAIVNQPMDMLVPPHQNSLGIWTYRIAPQLARLHEVTVYGKRSATQRAWSDDNGVRYEFVPPVAPNRRLIDVVARVTDRVRDEPLPAYASRLAYLDYAAQVAVRTRRWGADVIHIHNFTQFVPTLRAANPGAKIVLHMACEWLNQLDERVIDRRLADVDVVIGCSEYITRKAQERFPHHAHKCVTVENGVDTERATPADRDRDRGGDSADAGGRILFVGRVSPEKGVHDLVAAFVRVADEFPDARLDIVGPVGSLPRSFIVDVSDDPAITDLARFYEEGGSDYVDHMRDLVPESLRERVALVGGVPQDELIEWYRRADVVVNPSYSEAFGMSLVEAQACGTPVVATDVGGMTGIVSGTPAVGMLVARGDGDGLAAAIATILRDAGLRAEMGESGRRRAVERYGWSTIATALLGVYERVVCPDEVAA